MSTKPGRTYIPVASMTFAPAVCRQVSLISAMTPSRNVTSTRRGGAPVPSMTVPPCTMTSAASEVVRKTTKKSAHPLIESRV
jgi:hypothetical protein